MPAKINRILKVHCAELFDRNSNLAKNKNNDESKIYSRSRKSR